MLNIMSTPFLFLRPAPPSPLSFLPSLQAIYPISLRIHNGPPPGPLRSTHTLPSIAPSLISQNHNPPQTTELPFLLTKKPNHHPRRMNDKPYRHHHIRPHGSENRLRKGYVQLAVQRRYMIYKRMMRCEAWAFRWARNTGR